MPEILEREIAELIVESLDLDIAPEDIDPTAPLFNKGLGLDSIDVLELAYSITNKYGLQLRSDGKNNKKIFASLRSLSKHVNDHRMT